MTRLIINISQSGHAKNVRLESAFFNSAMRVSRSTFEIEAFLKETAQTFDTRKE